MDGIIHGIFRCGFSAVWRRPSKSAGRPRSYGMCGLVVAGYDCTAGGRPSLPRPGRRRAALPAWRLPAFLGPVAGSGRVGPVWRRPFCRVVGGRRHPTAWTYGLPVTAKKVTPARSSAPVVVGVWGYGRGRRHGLPAFWLRSTPCRAWLTLQDLCWCRCRHIWMGFGLRPGVC